MKNNIDKEEEFIKALSDLCEANRDIYFSVSSIYDRFYDNTHSPVSLDELRRFFDKKFKNGLIERVVVSTRYFFNKGKLKSNGLCGYRIKSFDEKL